MCVCVRASMDLTHGCMSAPDCLWCDYDLTCLNCVKMLHLILKDALNLDSYRNYM